MAHAVTIMGTIEPKQLQQEVYKDEFGELNGGVSGLIVQGLEYKGEGFGFEPLGRGLSLKGFDWEVKGCEYSAFLEDWTVSNM